MEFGVGAELRVIPNGLTTNPSNLVGAEAGLSAATNVLCRRPGIIEPRGSLRAEVSSNLSAGYDFCTHVQRFNSSDFQVASNGSLGLLMRANDATDSQPLPGECEYPNSAQIGSSLAVVGVGSVRMVDNPISSGSLAARACGMPRPVAPIAFLSTSGTAARNWLPTNTAVAYRIVYVLRVDGVPLYSPPTDIRVVRNNTGANAYVTLSIPTLESWMEGYEVQVYRSATTITPYSAMPSDDMRLRYSAVVTAADISLRSYHGFNDFLGDDDWSGPSLYTNATQDGISQANYAPGDASDVATYNGMTFLAGHKTAPQVFVNLNAVGDVSSPDDSLISVKFGGTTAIGSPTITGVTAAAFNYLAVGQVVTLAATTAPVGGDATFPALAKIVSWSSGASTITLDTNATTAGAVTAIAWDWIAVTVYKDSTSAYAFAGWVDKVGATTFDLTTYRTGLGVDATRTRGVFAVADAPTVGGYASGSAEIERAFSASAAITGAAGRIRCYAAQTDPTDMRRGIALLFTIDQPFDNSGDWALSDYAFVLTSTKPQAFDRDVDSSVGINSEQDGGDNVIAVSRSNLPEAFPVLSTITIGTDANVITRILATTDSLWALTTEGLWRIYGYSPESLTVQQYDPTARSFAEGRAWATKYGDTVYAWTARGIVAITAGGVQNIDDSIRDIVRTYTPRYDVAGMTRSFAGASLADQIVLFGGISIIAANGRSIVLCYSPESGAWTEWATYVGSDDVTRPYRLWTSTTSPDGKMLMGFGVNYAAGYYWELPAYEFDTIPVHYDVITSTRPTATVAGVNVTVTTGASIARVDTGDYIEFANGTKRYVTSAIGASVDVEANGGNDGQLLNIYKAFPVTVTYAATLQGLPMIEKQFGTAFLTMQYIRYGRKFTITYQRPYETTTTTQTVTYDTIAGVYESTSPQAYVTRDQVPRAVSRAWGLQITVSALQAAQAFQLAALSLLYEDISDWVKRS